MRHSRPSALAAVSLLGLALLILAWRIAVTRVTGDAPDAARASARQSSDSRDALAPAPVAGAHPSERRPEGGAPLGSPGPEKAPTVDLETDADSLEDVERLRAIAKEKRFHALAWPHVERLAERCAGRPSFAARIEALAEGSEGDVPGVRAALHLALVRGEPTARAPVFGRERRSDPEPEIRRAAWLALAMRAPSVASGRVALGRFESMTELLAFPLETAVVAEPEDLRAAAEALGAPLPAAAFAPRSPWSSEVREDLFTREVVAVVVFGPGAVKEGVERETLLEWLETESVPHVVLRDAAAHALALASAVDASLVERLLAIARSRAGDRVAPTILRSLLLAGSAPRQVADALAAVLDAPADPALLRDRTRAIVSLGEMMRSDRSSDREIASRVALERIESRDRDPFDRELLLDQLAISGSELLLHASKSVLDFDSDPSLRASAARALQLVRTEDRLSAMNSLMAYASADQPASVRRAVVQSLGVIGSTAALGMLEALAGADPDAKVRDLARAAAASIEARSRGGG